MEYSCPSYTPPTPPKEKENQTQIRYTSTMIYGKLRKNKYAEVEALILWPFHVKSQLIGKDPDARKDWGQEEKWATEEEVVGWHHWLNGHELEQTLADTEGQRRLVCCRAIVHGVAKSQTQLSNQTTRDRYTKQHHEDVKTKIWLWEML